ncbi:MAG: hypothetical protein IPN69_08285 [Acidobacteria bacterium]|nr:hypothetical protein [Acidobacteriota bacterium]
MIKLKVPKRKDLPEFVNQGNFSAELQPGKTIETISRTFADFLVREFGLKELSPNDETEAANTDQQEESE